MSVLSPVVAPCTLATGTVPDRSTEAKSVLVLLRTAGNVTRNTVRSTAILPRGARGTHVTSPAEEGLSGETEHAKDRFMGELIVSVLAMTHSHATHKIVQLTVCGWNGHPGKLAVTHVVEVK